MAEKQVERKIEVSKIGKPFKKGTHVSFTFHRHKYAGMVEKQLQNSAILNFDDEYENTTLAVDAKGKIIISYKKMKLLN